MLFDSTCLNRHQLPVPSKPDLDKIRVNENSHPRVISSAKRKVASALHLEEPMYTPCIYRNSVITDGNGDRKVIRYLPNGQVLGTPTEVRPDGRYNRWIYTRRESGVKSLTKRIKILHWLLELIATSTLSKSAFNTVKRISLVGFTTHISNLRKMVRSISREAKKCYGIRNKPKILILSAGPSFTGETKSVVKNNSIISLPLWKWKTAVTAARPLSTCP